MACPVSVSLETALGTSLAKPPEAPHPWIKLSTEKYRALTSFQLRNAEQRRDRFFRRKKTYPLLLAVLLEPSIVSVVGMDLLKACPTLVNFGSGLPPFLPLLSESQSIGWNRWRI